MYSKREFTIGELARAVEVPSTTIRYYERIGLLAADDRSQGNYRLYSQASMRRLKFIRAAQSIGFTLDDIQALLGSRDGKQPSCSKVQTLIKERLTEIEKRLSSLRHIQRLLKTSLAKCQKTARARCCHVIDALETTASP